jgi:hypothetical protein
MTHELTCRSQNPTSSRKQANKNKEKDHHKDITAKKPFASNSELFRPLPFLHWHATVSHLMRSFEGVAGLEGIEQTKDRQDKTPSQFQLHLSLTSTVGHKHENRK